MIIDVFKPFIAHNTFGGLLVIQVGARLELSKSLIHTDPYLSFVLVTFPSSPSYTAVVDNSTLMDPQFCMEYGTQAPIRGLTCNPIYRNVPINVDLNISVQHTTTLPKICECGKEKHGFANHSTWCPKGE